MKKNNSSLRLDDLGINGYEIYQDPEYFCFGIDAVLLSSFARVYEGENVLDLCTGNGIIPILLSAKTKASKIIGIEIQEACAKLAEKSISHNKLTDKIQIINKDLRDLEDFPPNSIDVITVNPPYLKGESGKSSAKSPLSIARHEIYATFSDIISCAYRLLKPKGRIYIVHRPYRLIELLSTMSKSRIEPKSLRFVHPFVEKEAKLVLIEGIKDAAAEIRIAPPLIVYDSPGEYTPEVLKIYGYE